MFVELPPAIPACRFGLMPHYPVPGTAYRYTRLLRSPQKSGYIGGRGGVCGEGWDGGDICERTAIHQVALELRACDTVDTILRLFRRVALDRPPS